MAYDEHVKAYRRNQSSGGIDMLGIGTAISGIANSISNGITSSKNYKEQKRQYEENMKFQREQFEYQKQLNQLQMEREDNAVQRRSADLKAAGINRLMADGQSAAASGGSSTSFSGTEAAQQQPIDTSVWMSAILDSQRIKNDKALTKIEKERVSSQVLNDAEERLLTIEKRISESKNREEKDALIKQYNKNIELINKQMEKLGVETKYLKHDLSIDENRGTKSSENTGNSYNEAKDFLAGSKGRNEKGESNNPIVRTAEKTGNTASPFKKKTIDKYNENIGKKPLKKRKSRKKYWFKSSEEAENSK